MRLRIVPARFIACATARAGTRNQQVQKELACRGRIDAIGRFKQLELEVDPFAFAVVPFPQYGIILFAALRDYDRFRGGNRG